MNLQFPDQTYSSTNKPSSATLKTDLQTIETDFNALDAEVTTAQTDIDTLETNAAAGWNPASATLTYSSADDPTYVVTTSVDLRSSIGVGDRIKFANNSTTFYGIVTAIAAGTMTLYGGTDYDVANSAITAVYFSHMKSPVGFPLDPTKWTAQATDTSLQTQASPVANTWYNQGSVTLSIPIGVWRTYYEVIIQANDTTASSAILIACTLSTANNSESDISMTGGGQIVTNQMGGLFVHREKTLVLAAKTPYYLNTRTTTSNVENIYNRGDVGTTVIRAICAYL